MEDVGDFLTLNMLNSEPTTSSWCIGQSSKTNKSTDSARQRYYLSIDLEQAIAVGGELSTLHVLDWPKGLATSDVERQEYAKIQGNSSGRRDLFRHLGFFKRAIFEIDISSEQVILR